jgi:hypothetical protein
MLLLDQDVWHMQKSLKNNQKPPDKGMKQPKRTPISIDHQKLGKQNYLESTQKTLQNPKQPKKIQNSYSIHSVFITPKWLFYFCT